MIDALNNLADFQPISKEAVDAFALRALDMACAVALGWTVTDEYHAYNPEGRLDHLEHYATDPTAARELEHYIEAQGLQTEYISALMGILLNDPNDTFWVDPTGEQVWSLLTATPEQKARAFLGAIGKTHTA